MIDRRDLAWRVVSLVGGAVAGLVTRELMTVSWKAVAGREPPDNPADRRTSWPEAIIWAAAVGVAVGVSRLVATRASSAAWEVTMHETPPGVQPD